MIEVSYHNHSQLNNNKNESFTGYRDNLQIIIIRNILFEYLHNYTRHTRTYNNYPVF